MAQSLPSHCQFLTSLVASLSQQPSQPPPRADVSGPDDVAVAPADANRRHLLLTLHVLFPGVVLPALDLLDRRLVTRVTVADDEGGSGGPLKSGGEGVGHDGAGTDHEPTSSSRRTSDDDPAPLTAIYTLRSAASTLPRRSGRAAASACKTYVVYLDAWSCSCAGFALEAFARIPQPVLQADAPAGLSQASPNTNPAVGRSAFGGMGGERFPGYEEDVPCCKHILACFLAERCGGVLGSRVDDRRATREELAGIISNV